MAEIKSLNAARAEREEDNSLLSPAEMLEDAAADIKRELVKATSALALLLDAGEDGKKYSVSFYASNLKGSEMVALCEAAKVLILQTMGSIPSE